MDVLVAGTSVNRFESTGPPMQDSSHLVSPGTTATAPAPPFEGPVNPTSAAIARLHPLGVSEVVLTGGGALGDWQRRNGARTLPHCVEQVRASGAVSNLEHVYEDGPSRPHAGMHFSDSDVYKVLEAAAWESVRGLSGEVKEFTEQVPGTCRAFNALTATSTRGSRASTRSWFGRTCVGATSFIAAVTSCKQPWRAVGQAPTPACSAWRASL